MNRAIWLAANEAGFPRIVHGQYAIFIALRQERISNGETCLKVFQNIQNEEKYT
jgi:hypothetical protein